MGADVGFEYFRYPQVFHISMAWSMASVYQSLKEQKASRICHRIGCFPHGNPMIWKVTVTICS